MSLSRIIIFLTLLIAFFASCGISENNDDFTTNSQHTISRSEVQDNWGIDKLVQESDCCVVVSKIKMINENSPELSRGVSKKIGSQYRIGVTLIEYTQKDLNKTPSSITILEGETPFLEEFESDYLIVFLKQAENYSEFYVTGNKNGVIETDFFTLKSSNENVQQDINNFFDNDYSKFKIWREEKFVFSNKLISQPYNNEDSSTTHPYYDVLTDYYNIALESTTLSNNCNSNKHETTAPADNN